MAESIVFILVVGFLISFIWVIFGITWDPRIIISALFLLLIPGFYAAFTAPFVPSARSRQKTMLKLAKITKKDTVFDLGCGDGRFVFAAAKLAKKAIGYELSIPLVTWGKMRGIGKKNAFIHFGDMFKQDYSEANVIFCYLLPGAIERFEKEIYSQLKKGTRIVSNGFQLHHHKPDKIEEKVYLYIKK